MTELLAEVVNIAVFCHIHYHLQSLLYLALQILLREMHLVLDIHLRAYSSHELEQLELNQIIQKIHIKDILKNSEQGRIYNLPLTNSEAKISLAASWIILSASDFVMPGSSRRNSPNSAVRSADTGVKQSADDEY